MTESQIIAAIEEALQKRENPKDFYTVRELAKICDCHEDTIKYKLDRLKQAGRLEVGTKRIERLDGRMHNVPAYRVKA